MHACMHAVKLCYLLQRIIFFCLVTHAVSCLTDTGKRRVGLVGDAASGFKGRSANTPFSVIYRLVGRRMCIFLVNEFRTTRVYIAA
jgi:hypothetical protein